MDERDGERSCVRAACDDEDDNDDAKKRHDDKVQSRINAHAKQTQ